MPTTTVTIGVPSGPSGWRIPEQVHHQLGLAYELREELVDVQLSHDRAVKDLWSSFPAVARVEHELSAAEAKVAELAERARSEGGGRRKATASVPGHGPVVAAQNEVKRLRAQRRSAIAAVVDEARDQLAVLTRSLKAERKRLYAKYCQAKGLYWATFNDCIARHKAIVKRVMKRRRAGQSAVLRHKRCDGTGTLTVQLLRQAHHRARTPRVLADRAGRYRNVIQLPWTAPAVWEALTRAERRHQGRGTVRMRCGTRDGVAQWVDVPIQIHRMLPEEADIVQVQLTITRTAGTYRARFAVTARVPEPEPRNVISGPSVAVHLGWHRSPDGIVAATWRSTRPLDIPGEWKDVIRTRPGRRSGTIVVSERVTRRLRRSTKLATGRQKAFVAIRHQLHDWLSANGAVPHPCHDGVILDAATVKKWLSPAEIAAVASQWRERPPAAGDEISAALAEWRRADKKLWDQQQHGRRKACLHRNDVWRNVAAVLARQGAQIVFDDMSIADLAARTRRMSAKAESEVAFQRSTASAGLLREVIRSACVRRGVPVSVVPTAGLSRTHAECGHTNPPDHRYRKRFVTCEGCGSRYDPEASATRLMLRRAQMPPPRGASIAAAR
ncbi:MAG: hypothetical protein J2P17_00190 [Mycobacterium sp.]|nr:hypothetical protein [Mycobacterium sp.]